MSDIFMRHSDIISEEKRDLVSITLVGVGGIGSHTALALGRMGYKNIIVVDDDTVSDLNVSSQGFDLSDVGMYKVDVVKRNIFRAVRTSVASYCERVTKINMRKFVPRIGNYKNTIVILSVDSMSARKTIYDQLENGTIVINPAMGAEMMTLNTFVKGHDDELFEKMWFTDENGVQETCTAKATIYTTLLIAGFISKIVKDITIGCNYTRTMSFDIRNNSIIHWYDTDGNNLLE